MKTGRRTTDWQPCQEAEPAEGERRGLDRRSADRRAPRRAVDPMFAATLVNQIEPAEDTAPPAAFSYFTAPRGAGGGRFVNLRA